MKVIPGTHTQSQIPHVDTFHQDNLLSRGQEIAVEVDEAKAVDSCSQPGEVSLHHIKLVHGSEPNRSADRRIGLRDPLHPDARAPDRRCAIRRCWCAAWTAIGNFDPEPRPRHDIDEAALAAHADAVNRQVAALYQGTGKKEFRA